MTGRYPFRIDVSKWPNQPLIKQDQLTVPKMLKRSGYRTAMVGKWHLGFDEQGYDRVLAGGPVDVGFDQFFGIRASTDIPPYFYIRGDRAVQPPTEAIEASQSEGWSPIQGKFWRAGEIAKDMNLENVLPEFTDEAISVLANFSESGQESEQPWFLYLAYPAPHTPWLPSEDFAGKSAAGMYGDFAEMTDAMIGRVLDQLAQNGMAENTLVIFSSDNGPTWYEQDVARFGHDSSGGLRGMKGDAFEAGHRVPFAVRWPGHVKPGSTSDQMVCFTDILATLAVIADAPIDEATKLDSIDFSAALLGTALLRTGQGTDKMRTDLVIQSGSGMMTVRDRNWKYIDSLGSGGFSKPQRIKSGVGDPLGQLYDLGTDLGETRNVYQSKLDVVRRMETILETAKAAN